MKFPFAYRCLAAIVALSAYGTAVGAPIVLTKADLSSNILQARMLDADKLCLVGETMDPDGDLQARGFVAVFSIGSNKVLWQKTVEAPGDNAASYFVGCAAEGHNIYVAANVDTHSQRSLTQSLAYVYQFNEAGKTLRETEIVTNSRNSFVYDIEAGDGGINVAGFAQDAIQKKQANAIFFARYESLSKAPVLTRLATGGFLNGTVARLSGKALYVGGNFAPASAPLDSLADDYAVSKILASKYQFSVRPLKAKADAIATAISRTNDIVSLGYIGKATTLTAVGPDGKIKQDLHINSTYCETKSLSANGNTVFAVRLPCGESTGKPKLLAIDRTNGAETIVKGVAGTPVHVVALDEKLGIVAKRADGSLVLQIATGGW